MSKVTKANGRDKDPGAGRKFKSIDEFNAALAASTDEAIVLLDGATVRGGVLPAVVFRTLGDGSIEAVPEVPPEGAPA